MKKLTIEKIYNINWISNKEFWAINPEIDYRIKIFAVIDGPDFYIKHSGQVLYPLPDDLYSYAIFSFIKNLKRRYYLCNCSSCEDKLFCTINFGIK